MDIDKARQAIAVQDKIDCCTGHLAKLADADSVKVFHREKNEKGETVETLLADQPMMLRRMVISTPDGGSERNLALDFTPDETKAILKAAAEILTSRLQEYTAALEAL